MNSVPYTDDQLNGAIRCFKHLIAEAYPPFTPEGEKEAWGHYQMLKELVAAYTE